MTCQNFFYASSLATTRPHGVLTASSRRRLLRNKASKRRPHGVLGVGCLGTTASCVCCEGVSVVKTAIFNIFEVCKKLYRLIRGRRIQIFHQNNVFMSWFLSYNDFIINYSNKISLRSRVKFIIKLLELNFSLLSLYASIFNIFENIVNFLLSVNECLML